MYLIKENHNITCQLQCTVNYKKDNNNNNKIIIISVTDLEEINGGGGERPIIHGRLDAFCTLVSST